MSKSKRKVELSNRVTPAYVSVNITVGLRNQVIADEGKESEIAFPAGDVEATHVSWDQIASEKELTNWMNANPELGKIVEKLWREKVKELEI